MFNSDTLEDFYNSPYMIGSSWKGSGRGPGWAFETRIDDEGRYEGYGKDPEGAHEKLGNGTYSFFDSKESLMYTMRSRFTNEYDVIKLPIQIDGKSKKLIITDMVRQISTLRKNV